MTLTARFSWFFLAALAVGLAGFTTALNLLARSHLARQQDERLDAALATLTAAVEVKPGYVEWESAKRKLTFGLDPAPDQPRWMVRDPVDRVLERSGNLVNDDAVADAFVVADPGNASGPIRRSFVGPGGDKWRVKVVRLRPPAKGGKSESQTGRPDSPLKHSHLTLVVGVSTRPADETLSALLAWSIAISLILWGLAAVGGRRLGRWALAPLTRMADAARDMPATDLGRRLPPAGTGDELDRLAAAFNDLLGRVQQAFMRQERFTAEASHQLRTPLTALLGQADVALRRERTPDEYRVVLDRVVRQGNTLVRLVDSLLFLARSEAGVALLDGVSFDVATWVAERLALATDHPRVGTVRFTPPAEPVRAFGHPELLGQAFDNLLDNAFKYSPPGSPIEIRIGVADSRVHVSMSDQGVGISEEDLQHVFDPFFRSEDARRRGIGDRV